MNSASPSAAPFLSCASSVEPCHWVWVGNSIDNLSRDEPDSHFSSLAVLPYKKRELFDSGSNPSYRSASDTSALPTDATTSPCRKKCPYPDPEPHICSSPVSPRQAVASGRNGTGPQPGYGTRNDPSPAALRSAPDGDRQRFFQPKQSLVDEFNYKLVSKS